MKSKVKGTVLKVTGSIIEVTKTESYLFGLRKKTRYYLYHIPKDPEERKQFFDKYEELIQELISQ
ncbi:hypothetical protein [Chryseobacterium shandongense]|uniref:Uncharacterized protein n=1 Tax=Chryseobacterium shandongense TaxID=1493872 RepID=A0ABM7B9B4_9FLAO|nr:hypothetical protein [Chryseobacterium shandongense]AZA95344.1 hypothetical protein EG353_07115 [Chryseobacterium shandongense]